MFKLLISLFGGWKGIGKLLLITALPIVLYNLAVDIIEEVFNFTLSQISASGTLTPSTLQLTGLAGYFSGVLKFPECLAVMVSFFLMKFTLRKIPFLHW